VNFQSTYATREIWEALILLRYSVGGNGGHGYIIEEYLQAALALLRAEKARQLTSIFCITSLHPYYYLRTPHDISLYGTAEVG
jgi:hypothetical protein